jgi:hypothetical protein
MSDYFRATAPRYMAMFMADFGCSKLDAAAVFGNAGYESNGFKSLQEIKPVVKGSRGGYGWFQWTGPRRRAFEAYCKRNDLDIASDLANYKWLHVELHDTEKRAIPALKNAGSLEEKVVAFEDTFERAGVKRYPERVRWAQIALAAFEAAGEPIPEPPTEYDKPRHWLVDLFRLIIEFVVGLLRSLKR